MKIHDCKAPECATCHRYESPIYEDVMRDTLETIDADHRDEWNGQYTLEQINIALYQLGELPLSDYQRNRIALEKLVF